MKRRNLSADLPRAYLEAFAKVVSRVAREIPDGIAEPVQMIVAGGAATYLYAGVRASADIDAVFSRKLLVPEATATYVDAEGQTRMLYLHRSDNDTMGLMPAHARESAIPVRIEGIDESKVDVRLLEPNDLAVTKVARFAENDQKDIIELARKGLIDPATVRAKAEEALLDYVGNLQGVRTSLDLACRLIEQNAAGRRGRGKRPR